MYRKKYWYDDFPQYKSASQIRSEKIERSKNQKMYLMSAIKKADHWQFVVKGNSGQDYDVNINQKKNICNCPDYLKKKQACKHIYFIVSRIAQDDNILDLAVYDSQALKNKYDQLDKLLLQRLKLRLKGGEERQNSQEKIDLGDDIDCAICFENLNQGKLVQCDRGCKKYLHEQCMNQWLKNQQNCPLCRNKWELNNQSVDSGEDEAFKKLIASQILIKKDDHDEQIDKITNDNKQQNKILLHTQNKNLFDNDQINHSQQQLKRVKTQGRSRKRKLDIIQEKYSNKSFKPFNN